MINFRRVFFYAVVFGVFASLPAFAQLNRISGQVTGVNRQPVEQAYVELLNEVNSVLTRTRTNGSGQYFFAGMSAGRFTVRVIPAGTNYEEMSQDAEVINVVYGGRATADNVQLDFQLKLIRNADAASVTGVVFAQEVPKQARKLYDSAMGKLADNKPQLVVKDLESAIQVFPTYFDALEKLGQEYINKGRMQDAERVFSTAVQVNPKASNSWYGLAFAQFSLNKDQLAIDAAKKASVLSPLSPDILLIVGKAQRRLKQYLEAEKSLLQAKKVSDSKSPDVSWTLALLYANNLNKFKEAADELENVLKLVPNSPDAENIKKLIRHFRSKSVPSNNFGE